MLRLRHSASATAYESNVQRTVPPRTSSSRAGYNTSSTLSPYSAHAASVAAPGPGAVATFPGEVQVGYQSRTGAQGSIEGRETARGGISLLNNSQITKLNNERSYDN